MNKNKNKNNGNNGTDHTSSNNNRIYDRNNTSNQNAWLLARELGLRSDDISGMHMEGRRLPVLLEFRALFLGLVQGSGFLS